MIPPALSPRVVFAESRDRHGVRNQLERPVELTRAPIATAILQEIASEVAS